MKANLRTFQYEAVGTYESIIFDDDWLAFAVDDVCAGFTVFPVQTVKVGVEYHGSSPNVHIFADCDGLVAVNATVGDSCMASDVQFCSWPYFYDRHDMMIYRATVPPAPADEPVTKDDLATRVEKQVGLAMKVYLPRIESDLVGKAISYGYSLMEVVLTSPQQGKPYPIGLVYEN